MWPNVLLAGYCLLVVLASLAGGRLPAMLKLSHARVQMMLSLVGGLMLAISLFVLFAHAQHELESADTAIWWTLVGMLAMFFLIRIFHFHQHGAPTEPEPCHKAHDHHHTHAPSTPHLGFVGVALGLAVHTLIDGIALAASVQAESIGNFTLSLFGFGTFLAIVLHKPLDAFSITSVMAAGGWLPRPQAIANVLFSLMCPLGAALFLLSIDAAITDQHAVIGRALAFSAGAFLCISLSDLLPEVQFHSHDRLKLSCLLLTGVLAGYAISRLEADHDDPHHSHHHSDTHSPGGKKPMNSSHKGHLHDDRAE